MKERDLLNKMWHDFVTNGIIPEDLDPLVRSSWERSMQYHINPYEQSGKVDHQKLQAGLKENALLISFSLPIMEKLYEIVKGSDFVVNLCDRHGLILKMIGDHAILQEAKQIHFVEGANWSEEAIGTNAIGTSIIEGKPLQIYSHEHFTKACHRWTCSAAPIYNWDGALLGVLNMSGPFEKVHPHTLGMVVSAVNAIENEIRLHEKIRHNQLMKSILEATTNTLTTGMLILGNHGEILKVNRAFTKMFYMKEDISGMAVTAVFENHLFHEILKSDVTIVDKELRLHIKPNAKEKDVLVNVQAIYQDEKRIGSLITFKEVQKVRQFVNHLSGNQASITFADMIGQNRAFLKSVKEAKAAANAASNVLLLGESGTGKDLFAQAIHLDSDRAHKPFIAINCGAIPRELLGSELFGYVEGAFTGARKGGNSGKFELADGGTIFLDEIGEMPLDMQVVLLRVLQNKEIVRLGGQQVIPINVRIIAATNKNLHEEVKKGSFRQDLFFRLHVMPIQIPSLRERKDDIPILTQSFVQEYAHRQVSVTPSFMEALQQHDWPGNVRELQNVLERTMNGRTNDVLDVDSLPEDFRHTVWTNDQLPTLPKKEEIKKKALLQAIEESQFNFSQAARNLGISRSTLYRQINRYQLHV